ncbi:MAG: hypothetical protein KKE44_05085 [Proteobacteria bacterium]|nr:hypothetical protein [Pseudomonadota bacterium]MBU1582108.1 hypothetical protein [Pseudomonadota bacterium]MBU2453220.1 hypothetical protein [Pseudomonadota bacterium]MBU2631632.1 hypothetical protein [Pseudomonadota bacterium]
MIKQDIDLTSSYLTFFPGLNLSDVSVFRLLNDGDDEKGSVSGDISSYNVILTRWEERKKTIEQIQKFTRTIGLQKQVQIVFEPAKTKIENIIRFYYIWRTNQYLQNAWPVTCHWIGVMGSPWRPTVVVPLKRHILTYVMTVGFRFLDGPFKVLAKKVMGQFFGALTWSDTIILVAIETKTQKR